MGENSLVQWFLHQEEKTWGIRESLILGGSAVAGPAGAFGGLLLCLLAENMAAGFLRIGEKGIEVVENKITDAKTKGGKKAELAKLADKYLGPGLNLAKSFFDPDSLEKILGKKDAIDEAKKFFSELEHNKEKKEAFEREILKFLTGSYKKDEFEREVKEKFGVTIKNEALDLYIEFRDFIFNDKVEKALVDIEAKQKKFGQKLSELNELKKESEHNLAKLECELQKFREDIFLISEGFYRLSPIYFKRNKSKGINRWKDESKPWLVDVYAGLDYRRIVTDEIEKEGKNFLIKGKSGYSKSTILYRVVCDFYAKNYNILICSHDFGGEQLKHPQKIVEVIRDLLCEGNVFVAVDDVQNNMKAFEIIKILETDENFNKIKFVFTAREPEFSDNIDFKKGLYGENTREAINSRKNFITEITVDKFDSEEAEGFAKKFCPLIGREFDENSLKEYRQLSNNGHPILFKYWLTGKGIENDIDDKYWRYIFDRKKEAEDKAKLKAALFSCIFDICGIKITDDLASKCVNLRFLKHWEAMHPVWDKYFLRYWSDKRRKEGENPEETIKEIINCIINLKDEETSYWLIEGLAITTAYDQDLLSLFEPSLEVPDYLDDARKAQLYTYDLGFMWLKLERFEKAIEEVTKAIKLLEKLVNTREEFRENLADAHINRGATYSRFADIEGEIKKNIEEKNRLYDKAIEDFNEAEKINSDDSHVYFNRGLAYIATKEYDLAVRDFTMAIKINPEFAKAYSFRGLTYYHIGEHDKAITESTTAIKINPEFATNYYYRGLAYSAKKEHDKAIADYTQFINIISSLSILDADEITNRLDLRTMLFAKNIFIKRGDAYADKGEYDLAINDYTIAIQINPKNWEAYNNRGLAYLAKKEFDLAIEDFTKAIEITPEFATAYYNRGLAYSEKEEHDQAINDYTAAIEKNPKFGDAYINRGLEYDKESDYDKAINDFSEAVNINPNDAVAYYNRGVVYSHKKDYNKAINDFSEAIKINPEYEDAYCNRGNAYSNKGEYDKAVNDFSEAIKINPKNWEAYNNRGLDNIAKKEYDLAIEDFTEAIKICPRFAWAYSNRRIAYYAKREYDAGVVDLANSGFLFLIMSFYENPETIATAIEHLTEAFEFDKSEHIIKYEAGVALAAIYRIVGNDKVSSEIMKKVEGKEGLLSNAAKAVLIILKGEDAEIVSKKDFRDDEFKDEAFALLKDLKEAKSSVHLG